MMPSLSRALVLVASVLGAFPAATSAASITSGELFLNGSGNGTFAFSGEDFAASGFLGAGNTPLAFTICLDPCATTVATFFSGTDLIGRLATPTATGGFGSATDAIGAFVSFTGPDLVLDAGAGVYTGPFAMTGRACGHWRSFSGVPPPAGTGSVTPCLTETLEFSGSGTLAATFTALPFQDGLLYDFSQATFTFVTPQGGSSPQTLPVPEPSTLLLIGAGLVGVGRRLRRRRV